MMLYVNSTQKKEEVWLFGGTGRLAAPGRKGQQEPLAGAASAEGEKRSPTQGIPLRLARE